jgi:colanic acid/amylovoran biosynthesis glycosyltransferase
VNPLSKPKVIVFSDHLLYPSETFIRAQANALSAFEPVFAGSRLVEGLDLPKERTYTINRGGAAGKLHEFAFKLFGFAPRFTTRLSALDPVLLHAHYSANGLRVLPLARNLGVPLIVTLHGSDVTATNLRYQKPHFGHRRYLANKEKLQKNATLFLAVSEFIRRKSLEQGYPAERVAVHYTGVNTRTFHPASTESEPLILFVGRMVESKGVDFLIRAASAIQNQLPDVEVILIGDGPSRADFEERARRSLRRYRFLGMQRPEEVRKWMNRASIFCVPSVKVRSGAEEAFGMVYAEAQAVEKPVVAFASGGIPEVVCHEVTGFLAPERDWQTLTKHLLTLLEKPELRKQFGRAGRERVVRHFDLEARTKVLEEIYAGIVRQHAPRNGSRARSQATDMCRPQCLLQPE